MLRLLFIFFFSLVLTNGQAQTQGFQYTDSAILESNGNPEGEESSGADEFTDTTLYTHAINISGDTVNAWKRNKAFAYVNYLDSLLKLKEQESLADYRPVTQNNSPSFLQQLFSSGIFQAICWLLAAMFILFILYKLFFNAGIFKRNTTRIPVKESVEELPVLQHAADFDALIHQSVKLADYRLAVRYLFLKTLWRLTEKGLLQYTADKTNYQYVQEIRQVSKKSFASLVLNYEYVWYGRLVISKEQFEQMELQYLSFYNKI